MLAGMSPLPNLSSGKLVIKVTAGKEQERTSELIAELALRGPFRVIAGSDWLPGYGLVRRLRSRTTTLKHILGRVHLARAFTCYQVLDLLESCPDNREPVLVLDFLNTFHVADIALFVRTRVLNQCISRLQRLSLSRPITVFIQPTLAAEYPRFQSMLASIADEFLVPESPNPGIPLQPRLFE